MKTLKVLLLLLIILLGAGLYQCFTLRPVLDEVNFTMQKLVSSTEQLDSSVLALRKQMDSITDNFNLQPLTEVNKQLESGLAEFRKQIEELNSKFKKR